MKHFSKLLSASKWKLIISSIGVMALVVFTSIILFEATKAEVVLAKDGEKQTFNTHAETVLDLLQEAGIEYSDHDALSHDTDRIIEDGMNITYKKAHKVTVDNNGEKQVYYTTVDTVGDFLKNNNLTLSKHDKASHSATDKVEEDMEVSIARAFQITINDGGNKEKVWTTGGKVEKILKQQNIKLKDKDKLKPKKKTNVKEDTAIKIVRVEEDTDIVKETIDFEVEKRKDRSMEKGKKKVIAEGKPGTLVKKYKITKENGEEVDRKLISKKVEKESKNRVVAFGTKEPAPVVTLASKSNNSSSSTTRETSAQRNNSGGKVMYMSASAYTAKCSGCSGYTTTGINLNANPNMKVIAVDPNVIPLGTRVWVEGYGTAVAGDTGGAINGNRIDLHFPTKSKAYAFGTRTVKVKILD